MEDDELEAGLDGSDEFEGSDQTQPDPDEIVDEETGEPLEGEEAADEAEETPAPTRTRAEADGQPASTVGQDKPARHAFQSPYAAPLLTTEEEEQADLLLDADQRALVVKLASGIVRREMQAYDQQYTEAKRLGVSPEFLTEYGDDMRAFALQVPEHLRGTSAGALLAAQIAISSRIQDPTQLANELGKAATLAGWKPAAPTTTTTQEKAPPAPVRRQAPAAVVGRGAATAVGVPAGVGAGNQRTGLTRAEYAKRQHYKVLGLDGDE